MAMTLDALTDYVRQQDGRLHRVARKKTHRLTAAVVANWPGPDFMATPKAREAWETMAVGDCQRRDTPKMPVWVIGILVEIIIKLILAWLESRKENEAELMAMQQQL